MALSDEQKEEIRTIVTERCNAAESHHRATIAALEATKQALLTSNERLSATNSELRTHYKAQWKYPQRVFYFVTGIAAIIFGYNLGAQTIAALGITKLHEELTKEVRESYSLREAMNDSLTKYNTQLDTLLRTDTSAHRVISLLGLAQDQLYQAHDPRLALVYLQEAEFEIQSARNHIKATSKYTGELPSMSDVVDNLVISKLTLEAQCSIAMNEPGRLRELAGKLACPVGAKCENLEASYYAGLVSTNDMLVASDPIKMEASRSTAIAHFSQFLSAENSGHPSLIYLAALHISEGDYGTAEERANSYLNGFAKTEEERRLLPSRVQAWLVLADALKDIAHSLDTDSIDFHTAEACNVDTQAIGAFEARLFKEWFIQLIERRMELFHDDIDDSAANAFGNYCFFELSRNTLQDC